MATKQLALIDGLYRCQNCGRDVPRVQRTRRFRLCSECWDAIVAPTNPEKSDGITEDEYQAREAYWDWYYQMEKRYPAKRSWQTRRGKPSPAREADSLYPYCECGRLRKAVGFVNDGGLWGGPYFKQCEVCEAKDAVKRTYEMAPKIWPGRDDEDILDLLQRSFPRYFELGVLPGLWFELKYETMKEEQDVCW